MAQKLGPDNKAVASRASEAIDLASHAGLELDPWQCLVLEYMLSLREDTYWDEVNGCEESKWAAYEFGLVVARQNGKGSILEARELAGLFLFGEKVIIHSAHLFDTSQKHFERIKQLIVNTSDLAAEVLRISNSHGSEGIYLKNGSELLFKARTGSAARGFTCDLLVLDEAMANLGPDVVKASFPTISARPNGQILYTGSAGGRESEQFGRARSRALKHLAGVKIQPRLCFMEWSAELCNLYCLPDCDEHDKIDDPKTWAKANPAMGFRISEEDTLVELEAMGPDGFAQERLSVGDWPSEGNGWVVISEDAWGHRKNELSTLAGKFVLGVDSAPGTAGWTCIVAAGANEDGQTHIEVTSTESGGFDHKPGMKWAIDRIVHIWGAQKPAFVVIDPASPAGSMIPILESKGVKVIAPTPREVGQWCGDFKRAAEPARNEPATLVHLDQTPLNTAIAAGVPRPLQELWLWSTTESAADITPARGATLATGGFKKHVYRKTSKPWVRYA